MNNGFKYNVAAFAQALIYSEQTRFRSENANQEILNILNKLDLPADLDIYSEISSLKTQIDNVKNRSKEIENSVSLLREQIENSDSSIKSEIFHYIQNEGKYLYNNNNYLIKDNSKYIPKTGYESTVKSESSIPYSFKREFDKTMAKISDTSATVAIAVTDGVALFATNVMSGTNAAVIGGISKIGHELFRQEKVFGMTKDEMYDKLNQNQEVIEFLRENPYKEKYIDANGVERYIDGSYFDDSLIDPDGSTYELTKTGSYIAANFVSVGKMGTVGIILSAAEDGGDAVSRIKSEGYNIDSNSMNYILSREAYALVGGKIANSIIGKIPQVKGLLGSVENIAKAGALKGSETLMDTFLQKVTYKSDKSFSKVFEENGGFVSLGTSIAMGAGLTTAGEVSSALNHYITNRFSKRQIEETIDEFITRKGYADDFKDYIMKDLEETVNTWDIPGTTISHKKDIINRMKNYIDEDLINYYDMKEIILDIHNNSKYIPESFSEMLEIMKKYDGFEDSSNKINAYAKKYGGLKEVNLSKNSLIMSKKAFNELDYIKESPQTIAFNYSNNRRNLSINVFQTSFNDDIIVHEGVHDVSHHKNGSGIMIENKDRGINEGATEFVTRKIQNHTTESGYDAITNVYETIQESLDTRGFNGEDIIGKYYFSNDNKKNNTTLPKIFNTIDLDSKDLDTFKSASYVIANSNSDKQELLEARKQLNNLANKIIDKAAEYKLGGGK